MQHAKALRLLALQHGWALSWKNLCAKAVRDLHGRPDIPTNGGPPRYDRKLHLDQRGDAGIELMSCRVTNHFNGPMTMTALTFELYAADGTKVGERYAFMDTIPPGQPASYTHTFMPEYDHVAQPVAYIKFGKLDGNVEGRRYTIIGPPGLSEAWSPAIAEARLRAEAVAQRQAAKKAKAEDKKKKKEEKEAQEKAEREARKAKSGGQ